MRRYEAVVILHPDMGEDDVRNFTERYTQLVKTSGGEIIKIEDWGLKRLAYLVKKKEKGRYILFDFVGNPALSHEMERLFKISEDVLKYLSVKLDHDVDLEAFKTPPKEEAVPAAEEAPVDEQTQPAEGAGETTEQAPTEETEAQAVPEAEQPAESQEAEADAEPKAVTPEAAKEGE
jgi:small subunit ribosomal protein S6